MNHTTPLFRSTPREGVAAPRGGAVAESHCSVAAASPAPVIKETIRIQTDKKMASDGTYYLITQRQGGHFSPKWNIRKILFHMRWAAHTMN